MIKLLKNYPYDNNYDYVKLFSTKTAQTNYFNNFVDITIDMDDDSYIKEGETFIIEYNYDYLVTNNINYLIFNNGYKDLYCFIIRKEYVDDINTRIYYEIDVMNTFHFDYNINKSFVERKVCNVSELTDFDEGINIGEHTITSEIKCFEKDSTYFAMFNGMKEQQLIFENGQLKNVVQMPFLTNKPLTYIDGVQYPLFFMPLRETYAEPIITEIPTGGGNVGGSQGDFNNGILSANGFRFIKGYEGFGKNAYDDGYGYMTIAYGVTKHGEPDIYNDLFNNQPVPEEMGAKISYDLKNERYGSKIIKACKELGVTKQHQFDALCSLAFNCGYGVVTNTSNSLMTAIKSGDRENIRNTWHRFYITSNGQASEGLELRRIAEANIFLDNIYEFRDIVTINADGRYDGVVTENDGNGWLPS